MTPTKWLMAVCAVCAAFAGMTPFAIAFAVCAACAPKP